MDINPSALLLLISRLQEEVAALSRNNAALRETVESLSARLENAETVKSESDARPAGKVGPK